MFDDRVPDPITRVGPSRDRPFEAMHFDRVEAARDAGDPRTRARQRPPRRPALNGAPGPAPEAPSGHDDPIEARRIGTQLDVRA